MSPEGASTLITSAPSQPRSWVQDGPDCTWVMSRTRTPSSAFMGSPPSLVHGLVHGSGGVDVWIDPDVDQRGLAGLTRPLQSRPDVRGVPDLLAVAAQHPGELVV